MVLIATDLPEPVVPATKRCGMRARSAMIGSPPMFLPRHSASLCLLSAKSADESSSRRNTVSRVSFGSSMPMTFRPGTTATRAETADIDRAMSSDRPITRLDLVPGAGSSS
jgi:hypothetical protein